jgi:hypothetical protein
MNNSQPGQGRSRLLAGMLALLAAAALTVTGTGQAHAGLDGPLSAAFDQHCATDLQHFGQWTLFEPVDRVTFTLESLHHVPDTSVGITYSVPGSIAPTTLTGHFDPNRHNVTFTFDIAFPASGGQLILRDNATWTDGTSFSDSFTSPLLGCSQSPVPQPNTGNWENFVSTSATQTCGTLFFGTVHIPYDRITVTTAAGGPYNPSMVANAPFSTDYWVTDPQGTPGAYTSGTTGTFGPSGAPTSVSYLILNPPASGELNVLTSVQFDGRTAPAHYWVPIAC